MNQLQFSLRALLVATMVLAVWLGIVTNRVRHQQRTAKNLKALGWQVLYDWQGQTTEPGGPKWLRRIIGDDYFQTVSQVYTAKGDAMDGSQTARSIPLLQSLPALVSVSFYPSIPEQSQDVLKAALPGRHIAPTASP